jgi:hypothetical protein
MILTKGPNSTISSFEARKDDSLRMIQEAKHSVSKTSRTFTYDSHQPWQTHKDSGHKKCITVLMYELFKKQHFRKIFHPSKISPVCSLSCKGRQAFWHPMDPTEPYFYHSVYNGIETGLTLFQTMFQLQLSHNIKSLVFL